MAYVWGKSLFVSFHGKLHFSRSVSSCLWATVVLHLLNLLSNSIYFWKKDVLPRVEGKAYCSKKCCFLVKAISSCLYSRLEKFWGKNSLHVLRVLQNSNSHVDFIGLRRCSWGVLSCILWFAHRNVTWNTFGDLMLQHLFFCSRVCWNITSFCECLFA